MHRSLLRGYDAPVTSEEGKEHIHMFCSNCGTQFSDEARFCSNCGAPVSGTASASGSSTQTELEQERPNPATDTIIEVEPGSLENAVREAQAGDVLRLKAGEHRLSHPLEID